MWHLFRRLFTDQRGEINPPQEITGESDWRPFVPDDVKTDPVLGKVIENAQEKDLGSLIKTFAHQEHRKGSALFMPGKDAKPEEVDAFKGKLKEVANQHGLLPQVPEGPDKYEITRPPEDSNTPWDDNLEKSFREIAHKHGLTQGAVKDLFDLYGTIFEGVQTFKRTSEEEGMAALKGEFGDKFDTNFALAKRLAAGMFKTDEEQATYYKLGLENNPAFLGPLLRLAPYAAADSSFMETLPAPGVNVSSIDQAQQEYQRALTDDKHPQHKLWEKDPAAWEKWGQELFKKAGVTGTVPM